jgi:hypothetical protein
LIATEERLQVLEPTGAARNRGAGSDDSQLVRVWVETDAVEEHADEVGDFRARGSTIRVQLVDDEIEDI